MPVRLPRICDESQEVVCYPPVYSLFPSYRKRVLYVCYSTHPQTRNHTACSGCLASWGRAYNTNASVSFEPEYQLDRGPVVESRSQYSHDLSLFGVWRAMSSSRRASASTFTPHTGWHPESPLTRSGRQVRLYL